MSSEFSVVQAVGCGACRSGTEAPFPFSMAFQPIVDVETRSVFAYEALVRGQKGETAGSVLAQVTQENLYSFDQSCRVKAIQLASRLGLAETGASLSINFLPGAVYSPAACIQKTLETARECAFPLSALIFELTEVEQVRDTGHLRAIAEEYRRHGFTLALDDFGAGFSGMNLLAELDVQELKLDARLVRSVDQDLRKRRIVRSLASLCDDLGVRVIAEAVETVGECDVLRGCGISLMQGYLFAKPLFECLPQVDWPALPEGTLSPPHFTEISILRPLERRDACSRRCAAMRPPKL